MPLRRIANLPAGSRGCSGGRRRATAAAPPGCRAILVAALAAAAVCGAGASKTWYGSVVRHPENPQNATMKTYFQTANNSIDSELTAVGLSWTMDMLDMADLLPMNASSMLPLPNGSDFNYTAYEVPMWFDRKYNETEMVFSWLRVTYTPTGFPVGGVSPAATGVYTEPLWTLSFHIGSHEAWERAWQMSRAQGSKAGATTCNGVWEPTWRRMYEPVAEPCFTNGSSYADPATGRNETNFRQTGDGFQGLGSRLFDFRAPEWQPGFGAGRAAAGDAGSGFNQSFAYGQFGGGLEFFQVIAADTFLRGLGPDFVCSVVEGSPAMLPVAGKVPISFCAKSVADMVVLEFRTFVDVEAGECDIAVEQPADDSFYPDGLDVPANCSLPGEEVLPGEE